MNTLATTSTAAAEGDSGTIVDTEIRPPGAGDRALLIGAAAILALGAFWLPITDESPHGWQVAIGVVGVIAAIAAAFVRGALVVAGAALVVTAGLSLVGTDPTLVDTSLAGAAAFAAFETLSLARVWASVGVLDLRAERIHIRAIASRAGIGALAAAACTLIGLVHLPSPGLIAAIGVLAASVVIIGSALRAVGAEPPPPPAPPPTRAPRSPGALHRPGESFPYRR